MTKTTILHLRKLKHEKRKFALLTAYDFAFASLFAEQGINVMLVGDSLGMTMQGHDSTIPVTMDDVIYHVRCVRRGAPSCLLLSDLPFMSYATSAQALENAAALMRAGANVIKLEGGAWLIDIVRSLTTNGVPVCVHLGLMPQSVNVVGGYKVQGRDSAAADQLLTDALALERAGAQLLLLECVPAAVAERVTREVSVPVIGIGAGPHTDGQVLVLQDALGISGKSTPSFAKDFLAVSQDIRAAIKLYIEEVETGRFPAIEHSFR